MSYYTGARSARTPSQQRRHRFLTFFLPGCSTFYAGFQGTLQVDPDEGFEFVDKASMLLPTAPLLPMLEAIKFGDAEHDFSQYDVITGPAELKKLLSWISSSQKTDFRIDLEKGDNDILFFRRWESTGIRRAGSGFVGQTSTVPHYRTNFEKLTTLPVKGNEKAFGHQRIITYV